MSEALRFLVSPSAGEVSARLTLPSDARALFVYAHGAGAGMDHAFMEASSQRFAAAGIGCFRYQFPYVEQGSRRPSPRAKLLATVRSAVAEAGRHAGALPLLAGGKSMGGRMTSLAAAEEPLGVRGLVFVGFPLHPAGKPGIARADHLLQVAVPMLFLQGTRDKLAELELLHPVVRGLGARATLHEVEGADHGFHLLKRSGRSDDEVLGQLADTVATWCAQL